MMKNPFFEQWFKADALNNPSIFPQLPIDPAAMMESNRKTLEAFAHTQQRLFENMQSMNQRNAEMMTQFATQQTKMFHQMMTNTWQGPAAPNAPSSEQAPENDDTDQAA